MNRQLTRVINVEENNIFSNEEIIHMQNALVLNYLSPLISLPFLKEKIQDKKVLIDLATKVGIKFECGNFYDSEGNLLTKDLILYGITDNLYNTSKAALNKPADTGIPIVNLSKHVIESKVIPKLSIKEETMSVEDLMAKLYEGKSEEKGSRSK